MDFFDNYFSEILLLGLFIFIVFLFLRVKKTNETALTSYDRSFEMSKTMMERQAEGLRKQDDAIKRIDETNRLLAEILAATKK